MHDAGILALRIWMTKQEAEEQRRQERALELALIGNDPATWLSVFYPETSIEERDFGAEEFLEDEYGQTTIPNLDGVKVRWTKPPTAEEAEEIFKSLLGNPFGTLTANDTPGVNGDAS